MVALTVFLNVQLIGSSNMPEDPFAPEYILASLATTDTPSTDANPFENLASPPQDTIPLEDRTGDFMNDSSQNPFDLQDPRLWSRQWSMTPKRAIISLRKKSAAITSVPLLL